MTRRGPNPGSPPPQRGFVVVGVVMFVLALTILGISLFSLSGYEAQFMGRSKDQAQAFYDASGGIERAKFMLMTREKLESVKDTLEYDGPQGVIDASAQQDTQTNGPVVWSPNHPIEIRVLAERGGAHCMLEASFTPHPALDYYKRLMSLSGGLTFHWVGYDLTVRTPQTFLTGEVWQNSLDTLTWDPSPPIPPLGDRPTFVRPAIEPPPSVPAPILDREFRGTNWTVDAVPVPQGDEDHREYKLLAPGSTPAYFKSEAGGQAMSILDHWDEPKIKVNGTVIWLLDKGMRFDYGVEVDGPSTAALIIVANKGTHPDDPNAAIWFFGGIDSKNVPVILVADGKVLIEQNFQGATANFKVNYISIYARDVLVIGPKYPGQLLLQHKPDAPGGLIDQLYGEDVLPSAQASPSGRLTRIQGSWHQVTESDPY